MLKRATCRLAVSAVETSALSLRRGPAAGRNATRGFFTVIPQGTVAYRLLLGRSPTLLEPGLAMFLPVVHTIIKVDMRERAIALDSLHAYTSDNVPCVVSGTLFLQVGDANKACFSVQDYVGSARAVGTSALRAVVGKFTYDEIIGDRNSINAALTKTVGESTANWGIDVKSFEVQAFAPANRESERQLEQQMEAERNRRKQLLDTQAAINVAEGNKQRTILNSEGELQAKLNEAEGQYTSTVRQGEALAAQITAVARGLAESTSETVAESHLTRASQVILELRRQDMLKTLAQAGNSTYFLSEDLGSKGLQQFDVDTQERLKKTLGSASRLATAASLD